MKKYEAPAIDIIEFETQDIMTGSLNGGSGNNVELPEESLS